MNIYIGNMPYDTDEQEIRELFEQHGEVYSVKLIKDNETGRLKGFGFVEMEQNGGRTAMEQLNEYELRDRPLKVNEARERQERPSRRRY